MEFDAIDLQKQSDELDASWVTSENCEWGSVVSFSSPVLFNLLLCSQGFRGEDGGGSLQRRRGEHHTGRAGGAALHLHLCGCSQAQRAEQENHVHPCHTAGQPNVHLAGSARARTYAHTVMHDAIMASCITVCALLDPHPRPKPNFDLKLNPHLVL